MRNGLVVRGLIHRAVKAGNGSSPTAHHLLLPIVLSTEFQISSSCRSDAPTIFHHHPPSTVHCPPQFGRYRAPLTASATRHPHLPSTLLPSPSTIHHSPNYRPPSTIYHAPLTVHRPSSTTHRAPTVFHHPPSTSLHPTVHGRPLAM